MIFINIHPDAQGDVSFLVGCTKLNCCQQLQLTGLK